MATRCFQAEINIVWKILTLYNLLEQMNIDYQFTYERATTIQDLQDKRGSVGTNGDPKGKESIICSVINDQQAITYI